MRHPWAARLGYLFVALQLTGCSYFDAPSGLITWQHPTKSAGDFELDQERCQSHVQAFSDHLEEAHNPKRNTGGELLSAKCF